MKTRISLLLCGVATLMATPAISEDVVAGQGFMISISEIPASSRAAEAVKAAAPKPVRSKSAPATSKPVFAAEPIITAAGREAEPLSTLSAGAPIRSAARTGWFGVGIVDLTMGGIGDQNAFNRGRVAGFIEGQTSSGLSVVASADTREGPLRDLFSDLGARDPDRVLNRVRDTQNYLTYGDDSRTRDDAPTSGKVFVKISNAQSHFVWGDFRVSDNATRLVRSDRTLYGARASHVSVTQVGDQPRATLDVWAASPDRAARTDVISATGGAILSLSRADILPGTEKIMIRTRDRLSGRIIESETLIQGADYRINTFQGVVILNAPITPTPVSTDVVREIVVAYEHVPAAGDPSSRIAGGRTTYALSPATQIGLSAQEERSAGDVHQIYGVDLAHTAEGYSLNLEVARSHGPRIGTIVSDLGGFGGAETEVVSDRDAAGTAVRLDVEADLTQVMGAPGTLKFWHARMDAGFTSADQDVLSDQTDSGVELRTQIGTTTVAAALSRFRSADGREKSDASVSVALPVNARNVVTLTALNTARQNPDSVEDNGERTTAELNWTHRPSADTSLWAFARTTLHVAGDLPRDDRVGLGAEVQLTPAWRFAGEVSDGDLGPSGAVGLSHSAKRGKTTFGLRRDAQDPGLTDREQGKGYYYTEVQRDISDSLAITVEARDYVFGRERGHTSGGGVKINNGDWTLSTLVTQGDLRDVSTDEVIRRRAVSAAFTYADATQNGAIRIEHRRDDSSDDARDGETFGVTGTYSYTINPRWRLVSGLEYLESDGGASFDAGRHLKAEIGAAWRGTDSDRLSALFMLSRIEDVPGAGVDRRDGNTDQKRATVLSADATWKANPRWTYGAKIGYRWMSVTPQGTTDEVRSSGALVVAHTDYAVTPRWSVTADVRVQTFREADVLRTGATVGLWREINQNAKIGVGYHAGGVNGDLRSLKAPETGAFINLIAKF